MSETENPKLDDMTFGEAFAWCRKNRNPDMGDPHFMQWRGDVYNIKSVGDVVSGFQRQALIDRGDAEQAQHTAEAMAYFFMGVDLAKEKGSAQRAFAPERAWSTIEEARNNTFPDEEYPPAGRMITDKRVDLLRIERQANGGWLIDGRKDVRDDYITRSDVSAAFTNTADMLRALADLLERDDEKRKEALGE